MTSRSLPCFLAVLLVSLTASTARAQFSKISFLPSEGTPQYQPLNGGYTATKLQMVRYQADGLTIVNQYPCSATTNCSSTTGPAAAHYRVTLSPLQTNEEKVSSSCNGVVDGSESCYDGPLLVTLRLKTGGLGLQIVGADAGKPFIDTTSFNLKYQIGSNPSAFWQTSAGSVARFPQGVWTPVPLTAAEGECHPAPVNPDIQITVNDNLNPPNVVWPWSGTVCDYYVDSAQGGGTVSDDTGTYTCVMPRGEHTRCNFAIPYGDAVRFVATSDTYAGQFTQGGGGPCSTSEPDDVCQLTANTDVGIDVSFSGSASSTTVTASAGEDGPQSHAADKGDTDVVVQQLHFAAATGAPVLQTITVNVTGTGAPDSDLTAVKLYLDVNHNGVADPDELDGNLVGSGTFGSDGSTVLDALVIVDAPTDILVAVDISETIQAAAHVPFAPWSLLLVIALPIAVMLRRRSLASSVAIVAVVVAMTFACGGGGGGGNDDGDSDQQSGDSAGGDNGDVDNGTDDDYVPPAGSKTYAFSVTAASATESDSTSAPATVTGLPLTGATISVAP